MAALRAAVFSAIREKPEGWAFFAPSSARVNHPTPTQTFTTMKNHSGYAFGICRSLIRDVTRDIS